MEDVGQTIRLLSLEMECFEERKEKGYTQSV